MEWFLYRSFPSGAVSLLTIHIRHAQSDRISIWEITWNVLDHLLVYIKNIKFDVFTGHAHHLDDDVICGDADRAHTLWRLRNYL